MPFATNQGVRIHYEVEGDGAPIVLYHGASGRLEVWRELGYTEPLKQHYRLVLLDARGHGESDKPHAVEDYEMSRLVSDVLAVLDDLNIAKSHFLGYSMGGRIGFGIARHAPQRFYSLIMGGTHPYKAEADASGQEIEMLRRGFATYVAELEARGVALSPQVKSRLLANDSEALLASTLATLEDPGYQDVLPKMEMPCLLFVGEADPNYAGADECVNYMPNADFLVLPGLNHGQVLRRSDLIVPQVTQFLATVTSESGQ